MGKLGQIFIIYSRLCQNLKSIFSSPFLLLEKFYATKHFSPFSAVLYLESIEGISWDQPPLLDSDQRLRNNAIFCVFCSRDELSLISEPSHDSLSRISFKAYKEKHWWPLDRCTHLKTVPGKDRFQVSVLTELELTCFKETAGLMPLHSRRCCTSPCLWEFLRQHADFLVGKSSRYSSVQISGRP